MVSLFQSPPSHHDPVKRLGISRTRLLLFKPSRASRPPPVFMRCSHIAWRMSRRPSLFNPSSVLAAPTAQSAQQPRIPLYPRNLAKASSNASKSPQTGSLKHYTPVSSLKVCPTAVPTQWFKYYCNPATKTETVRSPFNSST
jgi:hypothetical protein